MLLYYFLICLSTILNMGPLLDMFIFTMINWQKRSG